MSFDLALFNLLLADQIGSAITRSPTTIGRQPLNIVVGTLVKGVYNGHKLAGNMSVVARID